MKRVLLLVLFISFVNAEETENENPDDVKVVTLATPPECSKTLGEKDIAIFDFDIVYKVGDREENSRSKDQERLPQTLPMGQKQMMVSLEENLIGMCAGEQRKITIPPSKGFGNQTIKLSGNRTLEGEATIIVDVKLLQVIPTGEEDMRNLFNMIDADNSGKIEFEEIETMIDLYSSMLENIDGIRELLTNMFQTTDKDGDGTTSFEEFYSSGQLSPNIKVDTSQLDNYYKQVMRKLQEGIESCPVCDGSCPKQTCPPGEQPMCDHCVNKMRQRELAKQKEEEERLKDEKEAKETEQLSDDGKSEKTKKDRKKKKLDGHDHDEL